MRRTILSVSGALLLGGAAWLAWQRFHEQVVRADVLVVGAGNSGADIALEVARGGHRTWMSGRDTGQVPFRPEGFWGRNLFMPLVLGVVFLGGLAFAATAYTSSGFGGTSTGPPGSGSAPRASSSRTRRSRNRP